MLDKYTKDILDSIDTHTTTNTCQFKRIVDRGYFASVIDCYGACIATTTDGVGSKSFHARNHDKWDIIGYDCVAMNVNDLLCVGANPIGFQNHITFQEGSSVNLQAIMKGVVEACQDAFIIILGGETEVLKNFTPLHISGSSFGRVDFDKIIDGSDVKAGDIVIGLPSNGMHANGWTALAERQYKLIEPKNILSTKIYVKEIMTLLARGIKTNAIINITGGGWQNLFRIPVSVGFDLQWNPTMQVFQALNYRFDMTELYSTFNMGIGMMVIVPPDYKEEAMEAMQCSIELGVVTEEDTLLINGIQI